MTTTRATTDKHHRPRQTMAKISLYHEPFSPGRGCGRTPLSYKLIILGDVGAGKTSLLHRIATGVFPARDLPCTMAADRYDKTLTNFRGDPVILAMWDTAGQERFHSLSYGFYRNAQIVLLACDIRADWHFTAPDFIKDIKYHLSSMDPEVLVFPVLTKTDLDPHTAMDPLQRLKEIAQKEGVPLAGSFCVSAKTGDNVDALVKEVVNRVCLHRPGRSQRSEAPIVVDVNSAPRKSRWWFFKC